MQRNIKELKMDTSRYRHGICGRERDIGLCLGASLKSEIYSKRLSSEI